MMIVAQGGRAGRDFPSFFSAVSARLVSASARAHATAAAAAAPSDAAGGGGGALALGWSAACSASVFACLSWRSELWAAAATASSAAT